MISSIFFIIITVFLNLIAGLLSLLEFLTPDALTEAIETSIGYTAYFTGVLPIQNIMTAMLALLGFEIVWYGAKLAFKLFHMIPWVGKKIDIK